MCIDNYNYNKRRKFIYEIKIHFKYLIRDMGTLFIIFKLRHKPNSIPEYPIPMFTWLEWNIIINPFGQKE